LHKRNVKVFDTKGIEPADVQDFGNAYTAFLADNKQGIEPMGLERRLNQGQEPDYTILRRIGTIANEILCPYVRPSVVVLCVSVFDPPEHVQQIHSLATRLATNWFGEDPARAYTGDAHGVAKV
jgi:hypothetical protein